MLCETAVRVEGTAAGIDHSVLDTGVRTDPKAEVAEAWTECVLGTGVGTEDAAAE